MAADVLVSARVTKAKKDAAQEALREIGSTASELINCAFDYVIEKRELPALEEKAIPQLDDFLRFDGEATIEIDWGEHPECVDYRDIIREGKRSDYESIA